MEGERELKGKTPLFPSGWIIFTPSENALNARTMILSYQWLCSYLPAPISVEEMSQSLTALGLEVEGVEKVEAVPGSLEGLIVAQVLEVRPHPNADRLRCARVDGGGGKQYEVVCGAANLAQGQKVVFAPVGTRIHPINGEPFEIKKAKIRGELSEGMICAEDEIGMGHDHDGIMVLDPEASVGQSAADYFQLPAPDYALNIGLTPNRSDAFSHLGAARDLCAYLQVHKGNSWKIQEPELPVVFPAHSQGWSVSVSSEQDCPRYLGLYIRGIHWGPSPAWLVRRLQTIGVRSVNLVVDITQFVLHETGQPLHAFDAEKIYEKRIQVRRAKKGESFLSLEGRSLHLDVEDLVIADDQSVLCLAGVMGGKDSGVQSHTRDLFLESALFSPELIRRTSMRYGLRTDAALHFEKGVDPQKVYFALARAAALLQTYAKAASAAYVHHDRYRAEPRKIRVSMDYVRRLSGLDFGHERALEIWSALGFENLDEQGESDSIQLLVPSHKTDIRLPADLVEELLRVEGLDKVPLKPRMEFPIAPPRSEISRRREREEIIAQSLCHRGFHEILTNSIAPEDWYESHQEKLHLLHSISKELNVLRPSLLESGLEVMAYNRNRKRMDLRLFELGKVYGGRSAGNYEERRLLGIWTTGNYWPQSWLHKAVPADGFLIKSAMESLWTLFPGISIHASLDTQKGGLLRYTWKRQTIATLQAVDEKTRARFDLDAPVWYGEIDLDLVATFPEPPLHFKDLPRYPMVQRDLSLILEMQRKYEEVETFIRQQRLDFLQHFKLTDLYEGEKLGKGKKSLTIRFQFQHPQRTLKDQEVDQWMETLISGFRDRLNAEIRES